MTTEPAVSPKGGRWRSLLVASALAIPGVVLIGGTAAMLAGVALGIDPLWAAETLTLAEAAALKDNGEVARLIEMGGNVNEASAVRADMLVDHPLVVTPLEAAVLSERADMVELLLEHGARMDPPLWTRLMCYSASVEADDVRALLQPRRPAGSVEDCNQVEIRW